MTAESLAQKMVDAVRSYVGRALRPVLSVQRDLIGRLDKAAQAVESLEKRVKELEGRG